MVVQPGCMLVRQGQPGDSMFMLISGEATILQRYGSAAADRGTVPCEFSECNL